MTPQLSSSTPRRNLIKKIGGLTAGFPHCRLSPNPRLPFLLLGRVRNTWGISSMPNATLISIRPTTWEGIAAKYEHPLYKRMGVLAKEMGGHGGMNYLMLFRIIECLRKGEPMVQKVYEGCFWSAVGPLSEKSVAEDGSSQVFPDFTRGNWKTTKPLSIIS
jgi:hypothetical protein